MDNLLYTISAKNGSPKRKKVLNFLRFCSIFMSYPFHTKSERRIYRKIIHLPIASDRILWYNKKVCFFLSEALTLYKGMIK